MKLHRSTVLILSSNPAFSRELTAHWPQDAAGTDFVVLGQDLCQELRRDTYDLAIADAPAEPQRSRLKDALAAAGKPALLIDSDPALDFYRLESTLVVLRSIPGLWAPVTGLLGQEILRRSEAESSSHEAERLRATAEGEATLGRYMAEMRHATNNALTSILGNAELILLEPGLPAKVMAQADTIRNMALRLHEVFQRFSSIEKELTVVARESGKDFHQAGAAGGA